MSASPPTASPSADVILRQEPVQLALLDLYLGTANGLNVLDLIKVLQPQCACVIMTAHTSVETVTKSLGSGAIEYLGKPLLIDDLLALVRKVQASKRASGEATATVDEGPETSIIGRTPKMLEVYRAIARVAPTEASVLILGASGTGKELVARALHDHSSRAQQAICSGELRRSSGKHSGKRAFRPRKRRLYRR